MKRCRSSSDSAYDPNSGFALDLVYNLVFKLDVYVSDIKSAVRSLFLDEASRCWIGRSPHKPSAGGQLTRLTLTL